MNVIETKLPGVLIIEPMVFSDSRGFFKETYQGARFKKIGIDLPFVQDNQSRSSYGVLRGLHFQKTRPQGKLVSCSSGTIFDVAVDINPDSETFSHYVGVELSDSNHLSLWIPPGYAHGFCVLSDVADFHYKCTDFYFPDDEGGVIWNDPQIAVQWPIKNPILSSKDKNYPALNSMTVLG